MGGHAEGGTPTLRFWRDARKPLWLLSPAMPLAGTLCALLYGATGVTWFAWLMPFLLLVVLPACEMLLPSSTAAPPDWALPALDADRYYRALVIAYVPFQYVLVIAGAWLAVRRADVLGWIGLALTVGALTGIGMNVAHELGHKRAAFSRWLSRIAIAPSAFSHYTVAHQRGHHVHVATPEDSASARYGESFWQYLRRATGGHWRAAWRFESRRLRNRGRSPFSPGNEIMQTALLAASLFAAVTAWLGWAALPFLIVQAAYGTSLLEAASYVQHYALRRRQLPDGRYEPVGPAHTWDGHGVTNLLLYQVERHSDHHAHPARNFQALRPNQGAPLLPAGYASLTILAYVPPLWFRVMNPRVARHYGGNLALANHGRDQLSTGLVSTKRAATIETS